MMIYDYLGSEIVGIKNVRKRLNFYINGQRNNGFLSPIFLTSKRGDGKTTVARGIGRNLLCSDKRTIKGFVEVNGAQFKNLGQFVDTVVNPFLNGTETTLFLDEVDCLENSIKNWLLSAIQINQNNISVASYAGTDYNFDYTRFSIIFASTNPEKLRASMKNRLTIIELEKYNKADLIKILRNNSKTIVYQDNIEDEIVLIARESPRTVVKLAKDILQYCNQLNINIFGFQNWLELKEILSIRPLGLTNYEYDLLKYLNDTGGKSLTAISAKLGIDAISIRKDTESFLLSHNLLVIDNKRFITPKGQKLLKECEKENP